MSSDSSKPRNASKAHKHKWSKRYSAMFARHPGAVRLCLNGPCGAMKMHDGHIIVMRDGRKRP